MKFSFNAWPKRAEMNGIPVIKTKWHIEADSEEQANKKADRICERLTHGNIKDPIKHDKPEKEAE